DVQRGGPSTGLPTKTEQSDLLQAYYGRNGECPMPVIAASTPSDCFNATLEASRIALQHMTPVILLSDGYIANGAEPWRFPQSADIAPFKVEFKTSLAEGEDVFMPYQRDEKGVRPWTIPGVPGLEHRIGGLEKQDITGNVSYDADNHQHMVKTRQAKVDDIANYIPEQEINLGEAQGDVLIVGWGSTYGSITTVVQHLIKEGHSVSHCHIRYIRPFPKNLGDILKRFKKIMVPELNNGQLVRILRSEFLVDAQSITKIKGTPFTQSELEQQILQELHTMS
ncbi:MAG TPA: 2-oxoglutarate ferredoxin oxidoreductase subunit alpha, partial [Chitinophagaceae bacterium]|nr:2-oxoglutarate ferredoxin oxidoreductase subunit alpha [Chitinophagaceae bacterium]